MSVSNQPGQPILEANMPPVGRLPNGFCPPGSVKEKLPVSPEAVLLVFEDVVPSSVGGGKYPSHVGETREVPGTDERRGFRSSSLAVDDLGEKIQRWPVENISSDTAAYTSLLTLASIPITPVSPSRARPESENLVPSGPAVPRKATDPPSGADILLASKAGDMAVNPKASNIKSRLFIPDPPIRNSLER